jgi:TnpA family transposase
MKQYWSEGELVECWTLTGVERQLSDQRTQRGRLGLAVLLKFFQFEGRFPDYHKEVPLPAVDYVAEQLDVPVSTWFDYPLKGRSGSRDREQLRTFLGFRQATSDDAEHIQRWLRQEVVPQDQDPRHLQSAVFDWCREHGIEPPTSDRIDRVIGASVRAFETDFFADIHRQLSLLTQERLHALLVSPSPKEPTGETEELSDLATLSQLKADPGRVGLASVLTEIAKLERINDTQLPDHLFGDVPQKILERYRLRVSTESVDQLRRHPEPIRYTLLAAFCWQRRRAIIDGWVDLLIQIVHRVSVNAERKVVTEITGGLEKVHGKTLLLFRLAEAAVDQPHGVVSEVLFPVVDEQTLQDLVKEYRSKGPTYQRHVHTVLRSSYSHHYRRMLPLLLDTLTFRSNNVAHQPVIDALAWLQAHRDSRQQFVSCDAVPIDGVVRPHMQDILFEEGANGTERIHRINYEICVLQALRERLRCKEIWGDGADRFRNPDDDLPSDFSTKRPDYYAALKQPMDAERFIDDLQQAMGQALTQFDAHLPTNPKVRLRTYGKNRLVVTPLDPQAEPAQLHRFKVEIGRRWPMTSLLDVLKETELRVGFTDVFKSLGTREVLDRETLQHRLLLCLYGLGTNTGLKRMVPSNHDLTYRELLYTRHRFLEKNALREAIRCVVNATLAVRLTHIWGEGTTSCAADGKKFGAWDQNLMTEWHIRYGGRGVMIYWHVEKKSACIYSQLKRCSSSEVASMIEGVLRHCTEMQVERQYVDSKGQSEIGFAFCHLLGFDLLPRLKAIASQKLYRPVSGRAGDYPNLQDILTRPINWELIRQQYDEMIQFATALRLETAEPESILRRFTRHNLKHPTYQALAELGKAVKTIFLCRYLDAESLRQEINEGLNVVEHWNSANGFIFYGKGGEIATNRLEDQEIAVLALHLLQACLVSINTLMIQQVLESPSWFEKMEPEDFRALSPLIYHHINPYGIFELNMGERLPIETKAAA